MTRKKSSIGFDPLAWMKAPASRVSAGTSAPKPAARPTPKPAPVTAAAASPTVLVLGDTLNIADVSERHSEWKRLVAGAVAIEIDASDVQGIDTAGLQLLAALVQEAQARNLALRWRAPTKALRDGVVRLGLGPVLRLP
jgi:ABC-type transporter Mla MlaB component